MRIKLITKENPILSNRYKLIFQAEECLACHVRTAIY